VLSSVHLAFAGGCGPGAPVVGDDASDDASTTASSGVQLTARSLAGYQDRPNDLCAKGVNDYGHGMGVIPRLPDPARSCAISSSVSSTTG
jgi:hypothetical protein